MTSADDPIVKVESDYQSGVISLDERALLIVTAIKKPASLPSKYQVTVTDNEPVVLPDRDATLALLEIWRNWDRLSSSTQSAVAQIMTRPSAAFTYDTPGGFFKLHYDTTGANAVPAGDANNNGLPDYIEKCAAYCDSSRTRHVALGYLMPPSDGVVGGDSKYDVYFEQMAYYGYAQPEANGPMPWNDATSYLVLHRNFLGFPPNSDPEGDQYGAMKVTIAHEFHHSVQFAYDYTEDAWFMELDATYTEDVVFPLTHDNYGYLNSFFSVPTTSLMYQTPPHMYGCFIWGKYLAQRFDTSLMRAIWEGAKTSATVYTSLTDTLLARYGWTQDSAMAEFALWNFITSSRNDGLHHADAANYPLVTIGQTHVTYPTGAQVSPINPAGYAASYIRFIPGPTPGTLRLTFDGADTRQWAAWVIKTTGTNSHQVQQIPLVPGTWTGQLNVPNFTGYSSVTLVGINLTEFSAAASFAYTGEMKSVFALSSQILTDSMVYSGAQRMISFKINNDAPLDDVVRVSASDNLGWISMAPFDLAIPAGQSVVANIPVKPPAGTPLGTMAALKFRAGSRSDTTMVDSAQTAAVTVLQVGDVTFDGNIDIADLTALVTYLYLDGPLPLPVPQSGNFDCQGNIDISDLSTLVSYLYLSGPACPCRPF